MAQYAFLLISLSYVITVREQVEGERKGHLKKVIQDCMAERKGALIGSDG